MKLYTEEQVKRAMTQARLTPIQYHELNLKSYTPIELPSDEMIWEKIVDSVYSLEYGTGFAQGVKWLIEQIKEQEK